MDIVGFFLKFVENININICQNYKLLVIHYILQGTPTFLTFYDSKSIGKC